MSEPTPREQAPDVAALIRELAAFYKRLYDSQLELPEDVARVLRENLWDLYD